MNNRLPRLGAWLVATLLVTGCVTKSTYEELKTAKDREIAALQAERETLQRQRAELQEQVRRLAEQREVLEQNKAWLEQEQIALQTRIELLAQDKKAYEQERAALEQQQAQLREQVETLERQKAQLLEASKETQSQYDALVRNLTEELQKGQLQVRQYQNMLTVDVAEQLFFDSGEASLKPSGKEVLKKVGAALKGYEDKIIRVIGHTDNVPIGKAHRDRFPSNWELSAARATTVVRYLQEVGVPPERMIASGRAQYAPVASNDTAEGRRKNRRIEITLVDRALVQDTAQNAR